MRQITATTIKTIYVHPSEQSIVWQDNIIKIIKNDG